MAQLAPQEVKGEKGKVLVGRKVLEMSLITTGIQCRGKVVKISPINSYILQYQILHCTPMIYWIDI